MNQNYPHELQTYSERIAQMVKSRYGTIGWEYSISYDEMLKENPENV